MQNNALYAVQLTEKINFTHLKPQSILFVGGSRSGKSDFALNYANTFIGKKAFIATMQHTFSTKDNKIITDKELDKRIAKHQAQRSNEWFTIDEPFDLEKAISLAISENSQVILIDCITLWLTNLLLLEKNEEEIIIQTEQLARSIVNCPVPLLFVSNEVGMGVVPAEQNTRLFRDIQGKANQILASYCQTVLMFSCGIPILIKNEIK